MLVFMLYELTLLTTTESAQTTAEEQLFPIQLNGTSIFHSCFTTKLTSMYRTLFNYITL